MYVCARAEDLMTFVFACATYSKTELTPSGGNCFQLLVQDFSLHLEVL